MLSSLPILQPPSPHTLWYPSLSAAAAPPSPSQANPTDPHQNPHVHNHRPSTTTNNNNNPHAPHQRTLLSTLRADEAAVFHRKAHIRRFGANWLRPPGVGKTLQGMADERAEREEGEIARAREFAAAEAQAQAEAEAEAAQGLPLRDGGEGERDLDEEVPDAEADVDVDGEGGWSDAEDEVEDLEGVERSLLGDLEEEEGGGEVDLDAEVPDAQEGSYEHTDTEVEDASSDIDEGGPVRGAFGNGRPATVLGTNGGVLGSSVFGSSPVRQGRRSGGRGRGREN
ncbi:MAG: hypothetical protein ALECFALPRED_002277 [Alectoria fallacina]|uniref:Uncharacterized protein n=1 Tax=Alectoria fallacina TaxID=1903189 RepID=A0A8H3IL55_9LECA|nr:MAG: hypothetical protein ALECFALPRED_002277 [Alectoria fallacina]